MSETSRISPAGLYAMQRGGWPVEVLGDDMYGEVNPDNFLSLSGLQCGEE
jgi:hypothetical protein